ncbi:hypothetical protein ACFQH2_08930 [Natronoarchaeum sp. GCM10025703]|uniref:hypothetical protein n=1 Tax=unclassified Natronoarchaeum TaxID=2620183 RepID=UPI00361E5ABF
MSIPPQPIRGPSTRPTEPPTFRGMAAFAVLVAAIAVFVSYPLISMAVLVGALVTALSVRSYLAHRSDSDRTRKLRVPGVGAIEYRITARKPR